jgi:selenium metabolism protein YedF
MRLVDARGLPCPKPVLLTKEAIAESREGDVVNVLVDNKAACENVVRFAKSQGAEVSSKKESEELYSIEIIVPYKNKVAAEAKAETDSCSLVRNVVVLIASDTVGRPDEKLGTVLMGSFLDTLASVGNRPSTVIFMNAGVKLACQGSPHIEKLKRLSDLGVRLLVCGTCLDYFHLKDKIEVGTVSNMFTICETLASAHHTITV